MIFVPFIYNYRGSVDGTHHNNYNTIDIALYFLFEGMRWEKLTNKEKEEENMKQKDPVVYWSLFIGYWIIVIIILTIVRN